MSKYTVNILCPSGHRRKVPITSNSNLLQVLEDVCNQEDLNSFEWGFIYQRNKCDLTVQWRLLNIPTNATLEMYRLDQARKTDDINVQLQLPDNSRYAGWFEPTVTLQEMLDWYRCQPESMIAALDISLSDNHNFCPICSYLNEEIIGDYALSNTTLRELGLTSGTAVIRYSLRPISDEQIRKVNAQIDEKLVRRHQQQYEREQKPKQISTEQRKPSESSSTLINSAVASSNNQEYSIFRDPSTTNSLPTQSGSQRQSKSLGETLGLNFSLDLESQSQKSSQTFKFPEATLGKDLYRNESEDDYRRVQNERPCERRPLAYDLVKTRSKREKPTERNEDVPDSFFEITADELRSTLRTLQQQSSTENPLETKSMRERAQSARSMTYEQIAIRLVIDTRYILQGFFRPEEPISRLIDFARQNLVCPYIDDKDFYFYTTPPRMILSDLRKPFSAYDLAPAAFVHLGHRTISSLNIQLVKNISIRTIEEANQLAAQYVFNRARPANERERSSLYSDRPVSATSLTPRSAPRNPIGNSMDDKQLRDKLRKFLPGRK